MLVYNKQVLSIYVVRSKNGLDNVIRRVTWKYQVKDGSYAADLFRDTYFNDDVNPEQFINYDDLDQATILQWIENIENIEELKAQLDANLEELKNPTLLVEKETPWVEEERYNFRDLYVLFSNGKQVVGPIYWSSDVFNRYLKQLGLEPSLPDDILARQRTVVPLFTPLIIDQNTNTKIYKCSILNQQPDNSVFYDNDYIIWNLDIWPVEGMYQLKTRTVDEIKQRLLSILDNLVSEREVSGVEVTIQNQTVKAFSGLISRFNLQEKTLKMQDNDNVVWKFMDNIWLTLSKNELAEVSLAVENYNTNLKAWNFEKATAILQAATVEELMLIEIN